MAFIGNTNTTQAFTPAVDYFSGNGSTTAFTLSRPVASVAQVQVTIDNVAQNPSSAYTVSSNTITFTSAPLSGTNNIYVYYTSPITQVIAPGQGTVTSTSFASSTGTGAGVFQTSPTLVTPVLGAASATSITVAAGAVGTPSITTTGDTNTGIFFPAADTIAFSEGGAESVRIDSSGKVLVGTTDADNPTDGIVLYFAAQNSQVIIGHATGTPSGFTYVKFSYNASTIGNITQNGTTAVAYNTTSDYRLKENIVPLTGALNKVSQLKPVSYTWKSAPDETGEGFIAHELAEVCPHAVSGTKDEIDADENPKYQGIDTSFLVATLTAALQELKAINDTQAATITALTARIEALENR
jgi:hypothetical protein